jgi:hypothetical protein
MAVKQSTSTTKEKPSTSNEPAAVLMRLQQFQQSALNLKHEGLEVTVASLPDYKVVLTVSGAGWCKKCHNLLPFEQMADANTCQQCAG